jgi:hypothetical protein
VDRERSNSKRTSDNRNSFPIFSTALGGRRSARHFGQLAADDNSRARIIKATNYQNSVDLASLRGLDKIQRDIEQLLLDHGWFYDRRKNLYKNEGRPPDRIVSVPYLAAAVRAVALGDPPKQRKQRSRSLRDDKIYNRVFNPKWDIHVFL